MKTIIRIITLILAFSTPVALVTDVFGMHQRARGGTSNKHRKIRRRRTLIQRRRALHKKKKYVHAKKKHLRKIPIKRQNTHRAHSQRRSHHFTRPARQNTYYTRTNSRNRNTQAYYQAIPNIITGERRFLDIETPFTKTREKYAAQLAQEAHVIVMELCRERNVTVEQTREIIENYMHQYVPTYIQNQCTEQNTTKANIAAGLVDSQRYISFNNTDLLKLFSNAFKLEGRDFPVCFTPSSQRNLRGGVSMWDTAVFLNTEHIMYTPGILGHELSHIKNFDVFTWQSLEGAFKFNFDQAPAWYYNYRKLCEKCADMESSLVHPNICQSLIRQLQAWLRERGNISSHTHPKNSERIAYLLKLYHDMIQEQRGTTGLTQKIAHIVHSILHPFSLVH